MFTIWYFLLNFFKLLTLLFFYIVKFFRFNPVFFKLANNSISKYNYKLLDIKTNVNNKIYFKDLYNEYLVINKLLSLDSLNITSYLSKNSFFKILILNRTITRLNNGIYSYSINYYICLIFNKFIKNLNFVKLWDFNYLVNYFELFYKNKKIQSYTKIIENNNITNIIAYKKLTNYSKIYSKFVILGNVYSNIKLGNGISVINSFANNIKNKWTIKFSASNFIKYINLNNINQYNILYLRKNKVFNKGRYSRNRQYYRTGVYWCLYINIIAVVGIYFWFYRFTMNFGYLWWLLYLFIASFILPRAFKYRLYNIFNLYKSFYNDILWLGAQFLLITNSLNSILLSVNKYIKSVVIINNTLLCRLTTIPTIFNNINLLLVTLNKLKNNTMLFKWEYANLNYYLNTTIPVIEKVKNYCFNWIKSVF